MVYKEKCEVKHPGNTEGYKPEEGVTAERRSPEIRMAEEWGKQVFAARRHEDTTRGSAFTYTNSNHTKGRLFDLNYSVFRPGVG